MIETFDLYGINSDDIDKACLLIEKALGITLDAHESSYHGGAYFRYGFSGREHIILKRNFDNFENEWAEEAYKSSPFLLYINYTQRSEEFGNKFSLLSHDITLLRRKQL